MSRYIRQPGQSNFNESDDRQKSEWESIYSCYNWSETYSPVPRFEVDPDSYSAFKVVISGYCAPSFCRTIWKTNDASRYYTKFHPQCCGGIEDFESTTSGRINTYSSTAVNTSVEEVTPGQTVVLELYPGVNNGISWRGDVMSPQTCCYFDLGGRGIACTSWNNIQYVEICVEGDSGLRPTSCNSNWHVYGKRRG